MLYYEVGPGGTHASLQAALAAAAGAIGGDSVTIDLQSGVWGVSNSDDLYNHFGSSVDMATNELIIQTKASDRANPATILGNWWGDGGTRYASNGKIIEKNINHELNMGTATGYGAPIIIYAYGGAGYMELENCQIYIQSDAPFVDINGNGSDNLIEYHLFKNCDFYISSNPQIGNLDFRVLNTTVVNCAIHGFSNSNINLQGGQEIAISNPSYITGYNYGAGNFVDSYPAGVGFIKDVNPNRTEQVIQSASDTTAVMRARNAYPTSSGVGSILDNGDNASATADDILGTVRPQGTTVDRGAYELSVAPSPDRVRNTADLASRMPLNSIGLVGIQTIRDFLVSVSGVYGAMYVAGGSVAQNFTDTPSAVTMLDTELTSGGVYVSASEAKSIITETRNGGYFLLASISCTGDADTVFQFHFKKNGVETPWRCRVVTDSSGNAGCGVIIGVDDNISNNEITFYGESDSAGGKDCTFTDAIIALYRVS